MKNALPDNAKIAKEAKECMQECVSEFISFITSEGMWFPTLFLFRFHRTMSWTMGRTHQYLVLEDSMRSVEEEVANKDAASEKCHQEKRKTVNGEDILFAMTSLGFENYAEALKIYLAKYRDVSFTVFPPRTRLTDPPLRPELVMDRTLNVLWVHHH